MSQPLSTCALFSYNQEQFIREAVRGALSQTYSPLQILISDDCSQDRTFEIIREEVDGYEGPHEIRLNRNVRNLGIVGHFNRAMELAEGQLVVVAAGDDISLPARTKELVEVWSGGGVTSVYSDVITIDENGVVRKAVSSSVGRPIASWKEIIQDDKWIASGCSQAWDRTVFDTFGPLPNSAVAEDAVMAFRSALLGKVAYVDKGLVKYRQHAAAHTNNQNHEMVLPRFVEFQVARARRFSAEYGCYLQDLQGFLPAFRETNPQPLRAAETLAARIELYEYKGTALARDTVDRWREFFRILADARLLGTSVVIKTLLLTTSPMFYYRMQMSFHRMRHKLKRWATGARSRNFFTPA
jgi:glycosyltransferase involved in cell wall biosynthesis